MVAPSLYLIRDAAPLCSYVDGGGILLVTAFSDVVDEHDRFLPGGFTTRLGPALGLSIMDFDGILPGEAAVSFAGVEFGAQALAETVRLDDARVDGAQVLATFTSGLAEGQPAFTRATFGQGEGYYVATLPDAPGRRLVVAHLVQRLGIEPVLAGLPPMVEACARGDVVTLINHSPDPASFVLPSGEAVHLDGYGYRRWPDGERPAMAGGTRAG